MRVALVITELLPSGAEKCFVNLACYLHCQGHQVHVWQLWPAPPPGKTQLTQQLEANGIVWKSGNAVRAWDFVTATRWLKTELQQYRPQVLQSFLFHANVAAALAKPRRGCRFFGGARVAQPERSRQILQRWASRRMEKLICVSQSVANHCQHSEGIAANKLITIPNGLDLNSLDTASPPWESLGLPADARVLLFVGRVTAQKGIVDFIESRAEGLLERLADHHIVIMGEGNCSEKLGAVRLASRFSDRLHLVGWQSQALGWMKQAELLFLPSRYEGMPNVVLEAMAAGLPVVVFEVDGVRELLGNSDAAEAQIAPAGDAVAFAEAIAALASDRVRREEIGRANRQRVQEHFQLRQQLEKYELLYLDKS